MYRMGLVGNCQVSALVSEEGSLEWLCLPRPDSEPVFGRLLDPAGGHFTIQPAGQPAIEGRSKGVQWSQSYIENTNILVTEARLDSGTAFRITDLCPRFEDAGRVRRPAELIRIIEPLSGLPELEIRIQPVAGWSKQPIGLEFPGARHPLQFQTTMPRAYLNERTFHLREKTYFKISWGEGPDDFSPLLCERALQLTHDYWLTWVKHCSIPTLYQKQVIRSALALKLHCYEDTGAILAAVTTSLPEEPGGSRNWDYRYCWLRDASFALTAFHNLGHFEEMEGFLKFLLNLVHERMTGRDELAPVYALDRSLPLPETVRPGWQGHAGSHPVRSCNQAAEHVQNDVYGEMILALSPVYLDERFAHLRTPEHGALLRHLASICAARISQPDAGIWEIRDSWREHTFTNLLCWAGLDRVSRIQRAGVFDSDGISDYSGPIARAHAAIITAVRDGSLRNGPGDPSFDAALALLPVLHFPDRQLCRRTIDDLRTQLEGRGQGRGFFFRYQRQDDFGTPKSAFVICSFWMSQALVSIGRPELAMEILDRALASSNSLGLISEHFDFQAGRQLGNFPQSYSHVGLINAAFAVSPPWSTIL